MRSLVHGKTLAVVLAFAGPLLLLALADSTSQAGVQECNTRCQTLQTNCTLKCDGDRDCIEKCKQAARDCVHGCSHDAGTDG